MAKSLRERALAGETVRGAMVFEFFSPGIGQILVQAGAEYALFDMEHTGLGLETVKSMVAACRGLPLAPMVRVPRGEYHFLARALDVGAEGVMVPMVESVEQARAIAEATHYPPKGRRGAAFGFAHDHYSMTGDVGATMRAADARNLIIAQIETERGLDAVEAIAAVEGIDCLWLGHFDLTSFLGIPGQFDHPKYLAAIERIVAAGRKHKKALGYLASSQEAALRHRRLGFNLLAAGTDQAILINGVKTILQQIE
jgi:2-dehydro-3-deoxyglucarate aldolase/4-hydroxy-2-oxoheptanedioate aldolase